jgi:hypothetical protein
MIVRSARGRRRAAAVAVLVSPLAYTAQTPSTLDVTAGAGYSDNLGRVAKNPQSDTIASVGFLAHVDEKSSRVKFKFDSDVEYYDYLRKTFKAETLGNAAIATSYAVVPEALTWALLDNWGQIQTNPFVPSTPATREHINAFSTGPNLRLRFGSSEFFVLDGRYFKTTYQTTPNDSHGVQGSVGFLHEPSSVSSVGFYVSSQRVNFDSNTHTPNFDLDTASVRYHFNAARTTFAAEAGYSEIRRAGKTTGAPLLSIDVVRTVSPRTTLQLSAGQRLSDTAAGFVLAQGAFFGVGSAAGGLVPPNATTGAPGSLTATSDAFRDRRASAAWRFVAPRTGAYLSIDYGEQRYLTQTTLSRKLSEAGLGASHNLNPAFRVGVDALLTHSNFEFANATFDDTLFALSAEWRFGRRTFVTLRGERYSRNSSRVSPGYTEDRVWLHVRYAALRQD